MPMNPNYKAPWLAALRSGEYQQTNSVLYDGKGYCCLGVLCKVAGAEFSDVDRASCYFPSPVNGLSVGNHATLTETGKRFFGITQEEHDKLTTMNDGRAGDNTRSFSEIADWIEENL